MHDNFEVYLIKIYQIMCSYLNFDHLNGRVICVDTMWNNYFIHFCSHLPISDSDFLITQNQSAAGNVIQLIK